MSLTLRPLISMISRVTLPPRAGSGKWSDNEIKLLIHTKPSNKLVILFSKIVRNEQTDYLSANLPMHPYILSCKFHYSDVTRSLSRLKSRTTRQIFQRSVNKNQTTMLRVTNTLRPAVSPYKGITMREAISCYGGIICIPPEQPWKR